MKKCKKCGCENNDDFIYCINCGKPLNDDVDTKENIKQEISKIALPKKYIVIGIVVLAVVGILAFTLSRLSNNETSKIFGVPKNPICIRYQDGFIYGMNNGEITDKIEIDLGYSNSSLDHSIIVFFDDDDNIYFYNGVTIDKIDEDVNVFSISQDGLKIAYSLDDGLYVFDTKNKKTEQIFEGDIDDFVISPNGKYLAFISEEDMYIYDGTSAKTIDTSDAFIMIAINNDQEVFYTDNNDSLYVVDQNGTITQIDPYVESINFNRDNTECILFSNDAVRIYKGGTVTSIGDFDEDPVKKIVIPTATNFVIDYNFYYDVYQYDIDSFVNKYYQTFDGSLLEIDSNYNIINSIANNADICCISLDGKTVYLLEDENLYIFDGTNLESLASDVKELYDCDLDGEGAYYVTNDGVVSYVDSTKSIKTLGEYDVYSYAVNKDNYFIFFDITSKNAYASKSGGEPNVLVGKEANNIDLCISYDITYFVYDDVMLYIKNNCKVEEKNIE